MFYLGIWVWIFKSNVVKILDDHFGKAFPVEDRMRQKSFQELNLRGRSGNATIVSSDVTTKMVEILDELFRPRFLRIKVKDSKRVERIEFTNVSVLTITSLAWGGGFSPFSYLFRVIFKNEKPYFKYERENNSVKKVQKT
jgi:hypothetical protein